MVVMMHVPYQLGNRSQVHRRQQLNLHQLPDHAEDKVLPVLDRAVGNVRGVDVHDGAANGLGGTDGQVVVLLDLPRVQRLAALDEVQRALVNLIRDCGVDELAAITRAHSTNIHKKPKTKIT